MKRRNADLVRLTTTALFLALTVILSRLPFLSAYLMIGGVNLVEIGFAAIPAMICALLNGPIYGLICSAGADLIGALAFPNGSMTFYPGFTIDAALFGLIPVMVLKLVKGKKKEESILMAIIIAIASFGLYSCLPFVERIKLDGGSDFQVSTPIKAMIAIAFSAVALILVMIVFILSKRESKQIERPFVLTDILLVYLIRDFLIKSFMAPMWLTSLYGIPYEVSFISQLLTSLITAPVDLIITAIVIYPLANVYKDQLALTYREKKHIYSKVYKGKALC